MFSEGGRGARAGRGGVAMATVLADSGPACGPAGARPRWFPCLAKQNYFPFLRASFPFLHMKTRRNREAGGRVAAGAATDPAPRPTVTPSHPAVLCSCSNSNNKSSSRSLLLASGGVPGWERGREAVRPPLSWQQPLGSCRRAALGSAFWPPLPRQNAAFAETNRGWDKQGKETGKENTKTANAAVWPTSCVEHKHPGTGAAGWRQAPRRSSLLCTPCCTQAQGSPGGSGCANPPKKKKSQCSGTPPAAAGTCHAPPVLLSPCRGRRALCSGCAVPRLPPQPQLPTHAVPHPPCATGLLRATLASAASFHPSSAPDQGCPSAAGS